MARVDVASPNTEILPSNKSAEDELKEEKNTQIIRARKRMEIFETILSNTCSEFSSLKYIFIAFATTLGCIIGTCLYMVIPVHNLIEHPKYWYEFPMQYTISFVPLYAAHIMYDFAFCMNIDSIKTIRTFLILAITLMIVAWVSFGLGYLTWTYGLGLRYPVPFIGYIIFSALLVTVLTTIWFRFPRTWRYNNNFLNRLKWCVLAIFCFNLQPVENIIWTGILLILPDDFQWVAALFLPFIRKFNTWSIIILAKRSSDGDSTRMRIYISQCVSIMHTLFLTYTVGSISTKATSAVIIGTDFIFHIFLCIKIVYLKYKEEKQMNTESRINLLQNLVLAKMIDIMVPICYLACFIISYYGPNANTIGNISNDYWHYSAVEDVSHTAKFVCVFFIVDMIGLVICAIVLWVFCKINLYKAFGAIQNEFGAGFAASAALVLNGVSKLTVNHILW